jgi:hypothetical protein
MRKRELGGSVNGESRRIRVERGKPLIPATFGVVEGVLWWREARAGACEATKTTVQRIGLWGLGENKAAGRGAKLAMRHRNGRVRGKRALGKNETAESTYCWCSRPFHRARCGLAWR